MANYQRYTLTQLKALVKARAAGTAVFWTEAELQSGINEAICVWQAMTGEWSNDGKFVHSMSGTNFFDVPKQLDFLFRVSYVSGVTVTPLTEVVIEEQDLGSPGWEGVVATPTYWGPLGANKFFVAPVATTGHLLLEAFSEPPRLLTDGAYIDMGDEELLRITQYAQHYLALKEGSQEFANAEGMMQGLIAAAALRNNRLKASVLYRKYMGEPKDQRIHPTRIMDEGPR